MNQNPRNQIQYPGRYRHDKLVELMNQQGHSARSLAKKAKKSKTIIAEALVGECKKLETLWAINNALGGKWEDLFQLNGSQFHRAVDRSVNPETAR